MTKRSTKVNLPVPINLMLSCASCISPVCPPSNHAYAEKVNIPVEKQPPERACSGSAVFYNSVGTNASITLMTRASNAPKILTLKYEGTIN